MIFRKSLRRDLSSSAGIVFATLFTIMVTTTLIRLLGRAAGGKVDTASVLPLIAFQSLNVMPVLLVLTLYVAVLMVLTRAYRDSEMVIWFASGQSTLAWVRPVLSFAVPFVIAVSAIAFLGAPWANRESAEYSKRFAQREDVSRVAPGQFRESGGANRVFFVESLSEDQAQVRNVFVSQTDGERLIIVVSAGGYIDNRPNGDRFLVLDKGRRYDGERGSAEFRLTEFERYGVRIEPKVSDLADDSTKLKSTFELLVDPSPRNLGELLWRISLPISAVLLALLAIPLAASNPRVGRSINLLVALLVYVTYSNLLSLMQGWVAQGKLRFEVGVWVVHAVLAVMVAVLFWRRMRLARPVLRRLIGRAPA